MADAKTENTSIILDDNNYQFKATGSVLIFDGYLKVYKDYEDNKDTILPDLSEYKDSKLVAKDITYTMHTTKPPARYTESKLIKEMEQLGIGRPSTYATTVGILSERGYVKIIEKKFHPTEVGIETTDKLQEYFKDIINVDYTREMEEDLDKIAEGNLEYTKLLNRFYSEFEPKVKEAFDNMEKKAPEETGEMCPKCGHPLVIKRSKYGTFVACSNYPECKYIKNDKEPPREIMDCPKCGGKIVEKKTRKGKIFYGCNNYPKCTFATWDEPINEKCPKCGEILVKKNNKIKCSACDYEREEK